MNRPRAWWGGLVVVGGGLLLWVGGCGAEKWSSGQWAGEARVGEWWGLTGGCSLCRVQVFCEWAGTAQVGLQRHLQAEESCIARHRGDSSLHHRRWFGSLDKYSGQGLYPLSSDIANLQLPHWWSLHVGP